MLVGRDSLLSDIGSGLVTGPRDIRYTSILMGVRGFGKTVAVSELEQRAVLDGWIVIFVDASGKGLLERIQDEVDALPYRYPDLDFGMLGSQKTVERAKGIAIGGLRGRVSETVSQPVGRDMGFRVQLDYLATQAKMQQTSVLLVIDELHAVDRNEGRRFSNDMQHITKRSELPLAFVGAGLPEMKYTLLADKKMTFLGRSERYELPPLTEADKIRGLLHPIKDFGGDITDAALRQASKCVGDSPYMLQLVGHNAWALANAPSHVIDTDAVTHAVRLAQKKFDQNVSEPAFHDLSDAEQTYLKGVADLGGIVRNIDVAQRSGMKEETARGIKKRLVDSGYLDATNNIIQLTELVSKRVIFKELNLEDDSSGNTLYDGLHSHRHTQVEVSSGNGSRCRKWMPRKRTYCILARDHSGGCRSQ